MTKTDFAFYIGIMVWIASTFYTWLFLQDFHLSIVLGVACGVGSSYLGNWFYDTAIKKD
ncbi:hypothetical protein AAA448_06010 [Staphylococcus equorum]|uniref:hypothetical protein n=1 Tax=Staphylococcus equorum TaxID=246432 RepID=UPI003D801F08